MPTHSLLPRLVPFLSGVVLFSLALPACAAPEVPRGSYAVSGITEGGPYRGLAQVSGGASGEPYLSLERGPLRWRGPLVRQGEEWVLQARTEGEGAVGAIRGDAKGRDTSAEVRYRWVEAPLSGGARGRWEGRWRQRGADGGWRACGREVWSRRETPTLRVVVSVDWEGRDLEPENLRAMERFRASFPAVPLTHFLNAAYYTKPTGRPAELASALAPRLLLPGDSGLESVASVSSSGAAPEARLWEQHPEDRAITASIRSTLRAGDERGLHVHAWRSLVETAGVAFRDGPSFWGSGRPLDVSGGDEGHEVELGAYSEEEVRRLVRASRLLLAGQGLGPTRAFRAGGWVAPGHVLAALRAEGLRIDSSAVATRWHDELKGLALKERIETLWAAILPSTQPYLVQTAHGELIEMPDTGALADYVTAAEMIEHGRWGLAELERAPGEVFIHFGFHQETAARFLPRLEQALDVLAKEGGARVVFETISASAARFRRAHARELARQELLRRGSPAGGLPLPGQDPGGS